MTQSNIIRKVFYDRYYKWTSCVKHFNHLSSTKELHTINNFLSANELRLLNVNSLKAYFIHYLLIWLKLEDHLSKVKVKKLLNAFNIAGKTEN